MDVSTRTHHDSPAIDRLDTVLVRVSTWVAVAFCSVLIVGWAVTGEIGPLRRSVTPAVISAVGLLMLARGKPRAIIQLMTGGAMVVIYVGFVDTATREGALLGLMAMGITAVILVRHWVIPYLAATAGLIGGTAYWWNVGNHDASQRALEAFTPTLMFLFAALLFLWFKRELEKESVSRQTAMERLEEALSARKRLIASVSHELRTPLTAIVGNATLLRDESTDLSTVEHDAMVIDIAQQSTDLTYIVDDLLTAARVDMGRLGVERMPVELQAEAQSVLDAMGPEHSGVIRVVGAPILANGDPSRVRQILRNLLSNSLRYGAGETELRIERDELAAVVVVSDLGEPLSEEESLAIFEPYHRAPGSGDIPTGLGLGLAISSKLAELMGGNLGYEHADGRNRFVLRLPLAFGAAEPIDEAQSA